ncbi:formate acetyltransferase [bacterium]|nr:formate acetyltransferase [bacterium]
MLFQTDPATGMTDELKAKKTPTNLLLKVLLKLMAANFNWRGSKRRFLKSDQGWVNSIIGMRTKNHSVELAICFKDGKVKVLSEIPENPDTVFVCDDESVVKEILADSSAMMMLMLNNKLLIQGNLNYPLLFGYYISLFIGSKPYKALKRKGQAGPKLLQGMEERKSNLMKGDRVDPGVKYLDDPYLPEYSLKDFPRLADFLNIHFTVKPELCFERAKLVTDWYKENGFETKADGSVFVPELRQAGAFKYLMENRKPIIRENDLIAGTTTTREIGVVIYPDSSGTTIWSELNSVSTRELNPYDVSEETKDILHREVFPFWMGNRTFREWVRKKYKNPLSQQLDERFAVYFMWKTVALSHTIPDFPKIMAMGTKGIIAEINKELITDTSADTQKKDTLQAMIFCLEGLTIYSKNLSRQAAADAEAEIDPTREAELKRLVEICEKVPERPAETLDEAVNSMWISWIALHMENTNAGLSLGRLDQWLQPYYEADLAKIESAAERTAYIKKAIELIGCFYMRCTDHLPLVADIGNYLFGGSSSDQAITLGGQTPSGTDGVNDMTYIFLKVTEMLSLRDPNVNARFTPGVNSDTYLKRLCEVNLITTATPSMHNDHAVLASLEEFNYELEDVRDWSATGCVEPTLSGKHLSHTNCMMMNMVAALEMAMNNGTHPLMKWKVGPETGSVEKGDFKTFDDFYNAFIAQFSFLIDNSVELNNMLGEAHTYIRPTPMLSSLIDGSITKGKDVTWGGAKYNSSGAACIGLADVTDSLMAVKKLVFEEKKFSLIELKESIERNFANNPVLHETIMKKVPRFGSSSREAVAMANGIAKFTHDYYGSHRNFRGGKYTSGFWSMSNHVAFGSLSGALPSGKLAGKAFTPGLTPAPAASKNLLDNIRDVAMLDPKNLNNNIAFNVKVVPSANDSHEKTVETIFSYIKTFFELGGMQIQLNVVTSAVLKEAMEHPEEYRNLIVRISGYNAYFVTLNKDMQQELIERAEYGL